GGSLAIFHPPSSTLHPRPPMITPRNRLLFWIAAVVLPFALLGAVEPAAMVISFALIGALALVAIGDALGGRGVLAGIGVELPGVVRMSKDREAKVEIHFRNPSQR